MGKKSGEIFALMIFAQQHALVCRLAFDGSSNRAMQKSELCFAFDNVFLCACPQ